MKLKTYVKKKRSTNPRVREGVCKIKMTERWEIPLNKEERERGERVHRGANAIRIKPLMLSCETCHVEKNNRGRIITRNSRNRQPSCTSKQYTCTHMWLKKHQTECIKIDDACSPHKNSLPLIFFCRLHFWQIHDWDRKMEKNGGREVNPPY